jgi:uncharacterized protein YndB with AHSA1/START domain
MPRTSIDTDAPIVLRGEIDVEAPIALVWEVLSAIDGWPSWNPDVKSAALEGDLVSGSVFLWRAGSSRITSVLQEVDPPQAIAWTGKTMGVRVVHVYSLEDRGASTHVNTEESVDGAPARIFRGRLARTMDRAVRGGLASLKSECERRHAEQEPT